MIAKRLDSKYQAGERSKSWLKLPLKPGQDFVIGAYRLDGARLELLLIGFFKRGKLMFAGKVHQGLNPTNRRALLKTLQPLRVTKCPFANLPTSKTGQWGEGVTAEEMGDYVWLDTKAVAEIKFAEWTTGGVLRHAEFVALQDDKIRWKRSGRMLPLVNSISAPNHHRTRGRKSGIWWKMRDLQYDARIPISPAK